MPDTSGVYVQYPIVYDDNITILATDPSFRQPLKEDEFYALMVTDPFNIGIRPDHDYWNKSCGWIGLECTSQPKRIYISKEYNRRKNGYRGVVMLVQVKDIDRCCILD